MTSSVLQNIVQLDIQKESLFHFLIYIKGAHVHRNETKDVFLTESRLEAVGLKKEAFPDFSKI